MKKYYYIKENTSSSWYSIYHYFDTLRGAEEFKNNYNSDIPGSRFGDINEIDEASWKVVKDTVHKGFDRFNQIEIHEAGQK